MTGTDPEAFELAGQMSEAYLAFARSGDPNHPKLPYWPPYDLDRRATLAFDVVPKVVEDPRGEERRFFSMVHYSPS
jgi:para-nitrobenzyl esterase